MTKNNVKYQLMLVPGGICCELQPDKTVLENAQEQGISLPSSCRNGTCRACLCQSLHGQYRFTIEWPGLSLEEKQDGWILPCVTVASSDLSLLQPLAKRLHVVSEPG
ncbi:2Fe-2S iron-sulfur cluster-binding protein [Undibacterium rugosum]|uniref:2Fe-2S iron-sulfur cluster binding domain-containing protein n=1 Tax=Undibacterium rugosum TaxID=2762291 RepID=A0A923IC04_9BURK|nr:2Fe-2S iron-sulfur cluster-binding protein [Undibacterium rugosum]MBC3936555.1 2Fe-2S iron-sulfur cluster binding domain-containing protein [Undibacterium rugosum]MBR7779812.1 2Fe-2S iron-sulfur cluster binding domain-containing protein [Undibacterium rugosum]